MTSRKDELIQWITETIDSKQFSIEPASEDASFRSYYRLITNQSSASETKFQTNRFIVMDAPPAQEDCTSFIHVQKLLLKHQIKVPYIYAFDQNKGFMLLSDFGSTLLLDRLDTDSADDLYEKAMNELLAIQTVNDNSLPEYNAQMLSNEMDLFSEWFIGSHLATPLNDKAKETLNRTQQILIENATSQPQVLVHRDYHSRNIMLTENNQAGIIDFQDAVMGPISYDLASLLKDCYISWHSDSIEKWVRYFIQQHNQRHEVSFSFETFIRWFDLMAAQRHMKAIGIFCRLNYRDGKKKYLYDIPRTMKYLVETCAKYSELSDFGKLLTELQPTVSSHS